MISFSEMIRDTNISDIPIAHQHNIEELLKKVNILRKAWGVEWTVTSGYRTWQDHVRIYNQKGVFDFEKIPKASRHLEGLALDLLDTTGKLKTWIKLNVKILEDNGLYCEDFQYTKSWVHIQSVPPKSGKRFFIP